MKKKKEEEIFSASFYFFFIKGGRQAEELKDLHDKQHQVDNPLTIVMHEFTQLLFKHTKSGSTT